MESTVMGEEDDAAETPREDRNELKRKRKKRTMRNWTGARGGTRQGLGDTLLKRVCLSELISCPTCPRSSWRLWAVESMQGRRRTRMTKMNSTFPAAATATAAYVVVTAKKP
jgi:hypothetical protein